MRKASLTAAACAALLWAGTAEGAVGETFPAENLATEPELAGTHRIWPIAPQTSLPAEIGPLTVRAPIRKKASIGPRPTPTGA